MLRSIDSVISNVKSAPSWSDYRQLEVVLHLWPEIVGKAVIAHTRPQRIQKGTLTVATSSPAWAQNLAYQRKLILKKLNAQLKSPLIDIRFRPGGWNQKGESSDRPPRSGESPFRPYQAEQGRGKPENAAEAFQRWQERTKEIQAKAYENKTMGTCPSCRCPTPEHELRRYGVCEFCTRQTQG